jgi:hypothetical protein
MSYENNNRTTSTNLNSSEPQKRLQKAAFTDRKTGGGR